MSFAVSDLTIGSTYGFKIRSVIEYPSNLGGNLNGVASDEASRTVRAAGQQAHHIGARVRHHHELEHRLNRYH